MPVDYLYYICEGIVKKVVDSSTVKVILPAERQCAGVCADCAGQKGSVETLAATNLKLEKGDRVKIKTKRDGRIARNAFLIFGVPLLIAGGIFVAITALVPGKHPGIAFGTAAGGFILWFFVLNRLDKYLFKKEGPSSFVIEIIGPESGR